MGQFSMPSSKLTSGERFLISLGTCWASVGSVSTNCWVGHEYPLEGGVSQSEVLGWFYNPNTTPKDKERVVVCLHGTGQELH